MHDLLPYVHLSESLEYSQEGNVQSLPRDLVISSSMIPAVATVAKYLRDNYVNSQAPHVACTGTLNGTAPLMGCCAMCVTGIYRYARNSQWALWQPQPELA